MTMHDDIQVITATSKDKSNWNAYVNRHKQATPYHQFAWLEAVQKAYGHRAIGAIAYSSGNVIGIFPAVLMKIPLVGKQICALPYCDVGYGLSDDAKTLIEMQRHLLTNLTQIEGTSLEIRDVNNAPLTIEQFKHKKVRMLLNLPNSSDTLMAGFKSKLRSQIKKAEKNGLIYQTGNSLELINHFYEVYAKNMRDLGSPVHAKKWFKEIVNAYADDSLLSVVYHNNTPIGAGLIIKGKNSASIPWASTCREFNKLAPNMLLYWSLLAHCADNGVMTFDFGRSTYEEGTYRFKSQWGANAQLLDWIKLDCNSRLIEEHNTQEGPQKILKIAENLWRRLPLKLTVMTGSLIRPYINL